MRDAGMLFLGPLSAATVAALGLALDAVADIAFVLVPENCAVYEVGVRVTVVSAANNFAVDFIQKPLAGAATGEVTIATVTSGTTGAADTNIRKDVNFDLNKGDIVRIAVSNAGAAGSKGVPYLKAYPKGQAALEPIDVSSLS